MFYLKFHVNFKCILWISKIRWSHKITQENVNIIRIAKITVHNRFATFRDLSCFFLQKFTTYRYSSLMLFLDAKSTLRTAEVQCKRESPVRARLKLRSIHAISTEDPGRFFRDLWGEFNVHCSNKSCQMDVRIQYLGPHLAIILSIAAIPCIV